MKYRFATLAALALVAAACTDRAPTAPETAGVQRIAGAQSNVSISYSSGSAGITAWDPIYPPSVDPNWVANLCVGTPAVGLNAAWANPHPAITGLAHPWIYNYFYAPWMNAWGTPGYVPGSMGAGGHNWTKYRMSVEGNGSFAIRLLADNCSWIYLDGTLVGVQGAYANASNTSYGLTLNGTHKLEFIIFDGGGAAGGKFLLETTTTPPPPLNPDLDGDGHPNDQDAYPLDPTRWQLDNTPPTITPTVTGTLGANGWYTSNVNVSWAVTDAESNITSPACAATTVTSDTNGATFTCDATSAGGAAQGSVTIKRDATAPSVTPTVSGISGSNGWYTSNVVVSWSTVDGTSGIASSTGCSATTTSTDNIGTLYSCTATNGAGLSTTASVTAKRDATVPVVHASSDVSVEATSALGAAVSYAAATASDNVGVTSGPTCSAASGSTFAFGNTIVTCTATDAAGNTGTASFTVKIQDTTNPVVTASGSLVAEATSALGAAVNFAAATAADAVGATASCSAASGSTFAIGTTTVNCSATDAAGNTGTASFTVKVQDTTTPIVTASGSLVVEATSAAGAAVNFAAATAFDVVGATASCSAASGSTFAIGTTTVNCSATDAAGNTGTASFTVKVQDTTSPILTSLTPSSATLWPPNHQMVPISLNAVAFDVVGATSIKIVSVTSSEPDNGLGDGDTAGDIVVTGALTLNLRAERSGKGDGRTYTITVEVKDAAGNASTRTTTVSVLKSQGGK